MGLRIQGVTNVVSAKRSSERANDSHNDGDPQVSSGTYGQRCAAQSAEQDARDEPRRRGARRSFRQLIIDQLKQRQKREQNQHPAMSDECQPGSGKIQPAQMRGQANYRRRRKRAQPDQASNEKAEEE